MYYVFFDAAEIRGIFLLFLSILRLSWHEVVKHWGWMRSCVRSQRVCPVTAAHLRTTCDGGVGSQGPGWGLSVTLRAKHQVTYQLQFIETRCRHFLSPDRFTFLLLVPPPPPPPLLSPSYRGLPSPKSDVYFFGSWWPGPIGVGLGVIITALLWLHVSPFMW